jgi:hypothetical protein
MGSVTCQRCEDQYRLEEDRLVLRREKVWSLDQCGHYFEMASVLLGSIICVFTFVQVLNSDEHGHSESMARRIHGKDHKPSRVSGTLVAVFSVLGVFTLALSWLAIKKVAQRWRADNTETVVEKCDCITA